MRSDQALQANARAFERLVDVTRRRLARGRLDSAAAWTRVTASFATTNPHGALRDVRLDRTLDQIARQALPAVSPRVAGDRREVLHVLSEGHLIGGHVRMALRWVEADVDSRSHVVVTRPGYASLELAAMVRKLGGTATELPERLLVARARSLRAAAASVDVVICHTHGEDPVPAMAFGGDYAGAPVVMVNHADHVFWLGVGNVSAVINLRDAALEAAADARGYPRDHLVVVPTPLPGVSRGSGRAGAKAQLGLDGDRVVLVTLARPVKYAPAPWHPGFVDVLAPLLRDNPAATLVAVGADPADPAWAALTRELPGRVVLPGERPDPSVYLDAADIYLDSFPFGSTTSLLEAATRDVPVLASRAYTGMSRLMSSTCPLDDVIVGGVDPDDYGVKLAALLEDTQLRERVGRATGAAVRTRHGADAWRANLAAIYERAEHGERVTRRDAPTSDTADLAAYAELLMGIESRTPLLWTIDFSRQAFDRADRLSARARTLAVRGVQKVTRAGAGHGATAGTFLIPSR
ncbi:MAG TPA: glycosyltransferase [Solirubrobacter sp.]|nr:glycosyltransferase [Solirubrobacter sp.]